MKASRWQGNHPEANHQFYSDEDTLEQFGRLTRVYTSLANYTRAAVAANSEAGTPVMRPLFLMFEDDPMAHQQDYECAGSQIFLDAISISTVGCVSHVTSHHAISDLERV